MEGKYLGLAVAACLLLGLAGMASAAVNIALVPVGNAFNNEDPADGDKFTSGVQHYGQVNYAYNIGKYEVTAGQYKDFLNAVAKSEDTYGLYNAKMWSEVQGCKIQQTFTMGSNTYTVAEDHANRPVNYVSFWDATRFANWLQNGQPTNVAQGNGTTETGAYTLSPTGIANNTITRNTTGWQWAVTNEDEWYKAAYYKGGGTNAAYWTCPTSSNSTPSNDLINPDPGNNANFYQSGGFTIDSPYWRTEVGEFEHSESPYNTFDQGGNVWEWNEAIVGGSSRGLRGGSFITNFDSLNSDYRYSSTANSEGPSFGFRVSQVPEPTSVGLLGLGVIGMLLRRRGVAK